METSIDVPLQDRVQTCKKVICTLLLVGADDQDSEESEESFTPEEIEVPFISCHPSDRGGSDVGLKLPALCQPFSTLLASIHKQSFLFLAGKRIVMYLATLNNQDEHAVKLAYESLIQFLKKPTYQDSIKAQQSDAQFHNYNLLDVFYDLLVFGYLMNGSVPDAVFYQEFFIHMWDLDMWEPEAERYFTVLIDHLAELCEVLFSQPFELYSDPGALDTAVLRLIKQHVQLMMDTLERL